MSHNQTSSHKLWELPVNQLINPSINDSEFLVWWSRIQNICLPPAPTSSTVFCWKNLGVGKNILKCYQWLKRWNCSKDLPAKGKGEGETREVGKAQRHFWFEGIWSQKIRTSGLRAFRGEMDRNKVQSPHRVQSPMGVQFLTLIYS